MTQADSSGARAARPARLWVFNPFVFLAGGRALIIGLAVILASAVLGWVTATHFDGALDIHPGSSAPLALFITEGLVDWLSLSAMLALAGLVVRRSSFRTVDVFGTQALARWPYMIVPAVLLITPIRNALATVAGEVVKARGSGSAPSITGTEVALTAVAALVILCCAIWAVILMYRAYAVSCDTRGARGIVSFIAAVIAAEVASKVILHKVYAHFAAALVASHQ